MAKRPVLLATFAIVSALAVPGVTAGDPCPLNDRLAGICPKAEIVDGGVQIGAEKEVGGTGSGGGSGSGRGTGTGSGTGASDGSGAGDSSGPANPGREIDRDGYTVTGPITLSDLVNFRPAPGIDSMQPNGWMIVGLDTNFYATANVQVQSGLLLGEQAQVRFTPVRYHWAYGDGSTRSSSTPGSTWERQGVNEFDPTPTSHVYMESGTYYIDLTIDFAAEYRWAGSDWTSIAGIIPVPANRLVATAGGAKTVLVEHECTLNPTGPGC